MRGGEACRHMCVDFVSDRLATCLRAKKGAGPTNHKYAQMPDGKLIKAVQTKTTGPRTQKNGFFTMVATS